jgi:hypothetical protein
MTAVKRITNGDFKIFTTNCANVAQRTGNIVFTTNNFIVDGNVELTGNLNRVSITNTIIENTINQMNVFDSNIILNANVTTGAAYPGNSGVIISRGTSSSAAVFWNETTTTWQITSNVNDYDSYANISVVPDGDVYDMLFFANVDGAPTLTSTNANLTYNNTTTTFGIGLNNVYNRNNLPANVAGQISIAANTANNTSGGTGLYFNNNGVSGEFISRRKAFIYSLIF